MIDLFLHQVSEGQEMLVLEAMKMQNSLTAGKMGKVRDDQRLSFYLSLFCDVCSLLSDYRPISPHLYCKYNSNKSM